MIHHRVRLSGRMVLASPMHIGTGRSAKAEDLPGSDKVAATQAEVPEEAEAGEIALIERSSDNRPLITGSALKGVVRDCLFPAVAAADERVRDAFENLFGMPAEDAGDGKQQSTGGKLHFFNAYCQTDTDRSVSPTTAIDGKTGAALNTSLRMVELVPAGTCFDIQIVADKVTDQELSLIELIRLALEDVDLGRLGAAGRFGQGRFTLNAARIETVDASAIERWLKDNGGTPAFMPVASVAHPGLGALGDETETAHVALHFDGLMQTRGETEDGGDGQITKPLRYGADYVLTGRSVIGVLRAQAERICRSLGTEPENVPGFVELFGDTEGAGRLEADIFTCAGSNVLPSSMFHEQVAIDRFTGGARPRAKFTNEVLCSPVFTGCLRLRVGGKNWNRLSGKPEPDRPRKTMSDAATGLLCFLMRDLNEGDLTFGSGASKGYGAVARVEVTRCRDGSAFKARNPVWAAAFLTSLNAVAETTDD